MSAAIFIPHHLRMVQWPALCEIAEGISAEGEALVRRLQADAAASRCGACGLRQREARLRVWIAQHQEDAE